MRCNLKKVFSTLAAIYLATLLSGCEPEVGTDKWCEKMADTPKGDWSTNDAMEFAENCIFKTYDEDDEK